MQRNDIENEENSIKEMEYLIDSIKSLKKINEEDLATELGYNYKFISQNRSRKEVSPKFISRLKDYLSRLQNVTNRTNNDVDFSQPIIQVVLNLTYIGKKNADTMDKMAESVKEITSGVNTMAATNQKNTDIIAALVNAILPNSKPDEKLTSLLQSLRMGDLNKPVEDFLQGNSPLPKNQTAHKKISKDS